MSVLDVYILKYEIEDDVLANSILTWYYSIINEVFGRNDIPWDCTDKDIDKLKNKILSLSFSRQAHMIQHLLDLEYNLSDVVDEYQKNKKVEKLLAHFAHYKHIIVFNASIKKEDIPALEKKYKMKIFYSSDDYNIKKIRKAKLLKITEIKEV
jgi:CRISPR/Cas system-associated endoribonuclease Cas2